jgi:hypothetical protein
MPLSRKRCFLVGIRHPPRVMLQVVLQSIPKLLVELLIILPEGFNNKEPPKAFALFLAQL